MVSSVRANSNGPAARAGSLYRGHKLTYRGAMHRSPGVADPSPRRRKPLHRSRVLRLASAALLVAGLGLSGCTHPAEMTLEQPFAPPAQRELRLTSEWSFTSSEEGRRECVLAFPLPGALDGPRDFLLYVALPDRPGTYSLGSEQPDAARGFLIQVPGQLRGKTVLKTGTVRLRREPLNRSRFRIDVDAHCTDTTRIRGSAALRGDPREVGAFRRRYAADVDSLVPASQPGSRPGDRTEPRASEGP